MKIKFIKPSYEINMQGETGIEKLKRIEKIARLCYKSEDKITNSSYEKMIKTLVKNNHTAMLEHASFSVKFIANRAFTHELVRHRIASFAQESQRYVGYGDTIEFIIPSWTKINPIEFDIDDMESAINYRASSPKCMFQKGFTLADTSWVDACYYAAQIYLELLNEGWKPEQARAVLPNSTKTEIIITSNLRTWQNTFKLRDHHTASPEMQELMNPLHKDINNLIPFVF